jgi:hypothetical protein
MRRLAGTKWYVPALTALALATLSACAPAPIGGITSSNLRPVDPKLTDPALPSEPSAPNVSLPPAAGSAIKNRLVVMLHGTASVPTSTTRVIRALAADGYHVIGLRYEATVGTLDACPPNSAAADLECHRRFRSETVFGAGLAPSAPGYDHPSISVTASTSLVSRLLAYVEYLGGVHPAEDWRQYQRRSAVGDCTSVNLIYDQCDLRWSSIVAMGHSNGAGVALYLGKSFKLDRVAMLSGSYDAFGQNGSFIPAPWLSEPFATPRSDIAQFVHNLDSNVSRQRAVGDAVGLNDAEVNVATTARPYNGSRRLVTTVQPECSTNPTWAHSATIEGSCTPAGVHVEAWKYLASGS